MKKHAIIVRCPLVPKHYCINLFGTIWTRDPSWIDARVINHERIHTCQQRELLFIPFYILYLIEWLCKLVRYCSSDKAYRNISFEREAYCNEANFYYIPVRRHYAWLHRIFR